MKECPKCLNCYEDILTDCPIDNIELKESMPGSTILAAKFRIESRLGRGGMGTVYRATHLGLRRDVAIKILREDKPKSGFLERFRREAEAIGRIKHPNVVDVMDFGFVEINNNPIGYLVMEFLSGQTLRSLLKEKGKLPLNQAVEIITQVCNAINAAHELGIIHRDLKPENIWLEKVDSYKIKVLDFGVAKLLDRQNIDNKENKSSIQENEEDSNLLIEPAKLSKTFAQLSSKSKKTESSEEKNSSQSNSNADRTETNAKAKTKELGIETELLRDTVNHITQTGAMIGTLPYMSPEQCVSSPNITSSSDIYSLGIIAYELLAGKRPFSSKGFELAVQHLNDEPPPIREVVSNIPKQVEDAIFFALAKKPNERPKSALEFADLFSAYLREKQQKKARIKTFLTWSLTIFTIVIVITTIYQSKLLLREYYYQITASLGWKVPITIVKRHSVVNLVDIKSHQEKIIASTESEEIDVSALSQQNPGRFQAQFSLDNQLFILHNFNEDVVEVWDSLKKEKIYQISQDLLPNRLVGASFSSNGQFIILTGLNRINILDTKTGKLINKITTYQRNDYLVTFPIDPNQFILASIQHPVLEQRLSGNFYPLEETSSLLSIWNISSSQKLKELTQQFGEIEFIYTAKDLALIQWHVSENEPSRRVELWNINGTLLEKWDITGLGGASIAYDASKIGFAISSNKIIEFDLNLKKIIQEHNISSNTKIRKIVYDQNNLLNIITSKYISELNTNTEYYQQQPNVSILDWSKTNNLVLVEKFITQEVNSQK